MPHRTRRPSRSENRFRQREVSRALRAAHEAGEAIDRVEIDPHTGKISVILAKSGERVADNEVENWVSKQKG